MKNFISAMTLKGVDKDIFHLVFPWTFNKEVIRWYNTIDPLQVTNWDDLCNELLSQYSYNTDLPIMLRDLELLKQEKKDGFTDYLAR